MNDAEDVERVARAICLCGNEGRDVWDSLSPARRNLAMNMARAAMDEIKKIIDEAS